MSLRSVDWTVTASAIPSRTNRSSSSIRPSAIRLGSTLRGAYLSFRQRSGLCGVVGTAAAAIEQLAQFARLQRLAQAVDRGHDLGLGSGRLTLEAARRAHQVLPA